jgi:O-antigen ligase
MNRERTRDSAPHIEIDTTDRRRLVATFTRNVIETSALNSFESVAEVPAEPGIPRQVLTWLLFWPLLCLIARQAPYFSGPAREAMTYQQGAAAGPGTDYHPYLYSNMAIQAAFILSAFRGAFKVLKQNPLIPAGLIWLFASVLWSDAPGNTIRMGIEVSLCTLFACYLAIRISPEHLMRLLMFMGVVSAFGSILFVVALPSYGLFAGYAGGAWNGICEHKNTLGVSMAYLLTPVFFVQEVHRLYRCLYVVLLLFLIVMSQSRGAWMDTAGVLFFIGGMILFRKLGKIESFFFIILALCSVAAAIIVVVSSFDILVTLLGKDTSMSGRAEIYPQVWQSIVKSPVVGYGYGGFWGTNLDKHWVLGKRDPRVGSAIGSDRPHTHCLDDRQSLASRTSIAPLAFLFAACRVVS